ATLGWLLPWAPHSPLLNLWQPPPAGIAVVAWIALAGVALLAFVCARRRIPLALPLALLCAPLLPVAAAARVEPGVRFAERSLALSCAGLAIAIGWALDQAPARWRPVAIAAGTGWIAWQLLAAWPAISAWRNEESRIRRVAEMRPRDTDALLG